MKKKTAHGTETINPSGTSLSFNGGQNCSSSAQKSVSESFSHHLHKRLWGPRDPLSQPNRRDSRPLMVLCYSSCTLTESIWIKTLRGGGLTRCSLKDPLWAQKMSSYRRFDYSGLNTDTSYNSASLLRMTTRVIDGT